jgi:Fe-S cluster biosynthesis and repair protein YggX
MKREQAPEICPADLERVRAFIEKSRWVFAKTMADHPHEYTLRKEADEGEFLFFVIFIREHGYPGRFGGRRYTYLDVEGWQYWTMGAPLANTILINRARKSDGTDADMLIASPNEYREEE